MVAGRGRGGGGGLLSFGAAGSQGGRQRHGLQAAGEEGRAAEEDIVGIHAGRQLLGQLPFIHLPSTHLPFIQMPSMHLPFINMPSRPISLLLGVTGINDLLGRLADRTFNSGLC